MPKGPAVSVRKLQLVKQIGPWKLQDIRSLKRLCNGALLKKPPYSDINRARGELQKEPVFQWLAKEIPRTVPLPSLTNPGELRVTRARANGNAQSSVVAVNRSLTRASLNSKLVNRGAADLFPATIMLKEPFISAQRTSAAPSM